MPTVPHTERHFAASATVRDVVIGMADGLTVPFALAAGLSSAVSATHVVLTAGSAEIAAGALAMGLGGYLAARSDAEHYRAELAREQRETVEVPELERAEVAEILRDYGISEAAIAPVVKELSADRARWVRFMMRFELGLEAPDPRRERSSALTIGLSYVAGGLIPLWPYLAFSTQRTALAVSTVVTLSALGIFGAIKARFTGAPLLRSAMQTLFVGGLAAGAAYALARALA
jgi:VIT1/CCC1 family predicted Fe2+/Mn2+ transporter